MTHADSRPNATTPVAEADAGGPPQPPTGSLADKSILCELAFAQYRRRVEAGETIDLEEFASHFPSCKSSLLTVLITHEYFQQHPEQLLAEALPDWPEPDQELLGFRILCGLGAGSFAHVYLARQPALGNRLVVLKVSPLHAGEAKTLGKLEHPHIVPVHSVDHDPGRGISVLCMPFLGRATLCDVLDLAFTKSRPPRGADVFRAAIAGSAVPGIPDAAPPPCQAFRSGGYVDAVIEVARQLAEALAFVHARDVCHRDLKPSNVLLGHDGRAMLLDFNLSDDPELREERLGGTLPYMAPEHLRAVAHDRPAGAPEPDGRADLYSLGVILFELLTGQHPCGSFDYHMPQEPFRQTLLARQAEGVRRIRPLNPGVDRALEQVIARCLAFDPADRFASAADLVTALTKCQSRTRRALRWGTKHRPVLLRVALVFVLALSAGGMYWSQLPSLAERQYEQGMNAYRDGDNHRAIEALTDVLGQPSPPTVAYYYRGRAYLRVGNFARAAEDFCRAAEIADADPVSKEGSGRAAACAAYSFGKFKPDDARTAAEVTQRAIAYCWKAIQANYAPAVMYNNLGYLTARSASRSEEAKRYLGKAIELDKTLQAAYHRRARIDLVAASSGRYAARGYEPKQGIQDIEHAKKVGLTTPELLYDAFCLYMQAFQNNRQKRVYFDRAKAEIERLVALDWFTRQMADDPFFRRVRGELGIPIPDDGLADRARLPVPLLFLDPVKE